MTIISRCLKKCLFPVALLIAAVVSGCAALPPGADFPKLASTAFAHPEQTQLGKQLESMERKNGGNSGFRLINAGVDGFLVRIQMINAAERSLDLQYHIFRGDSTGRLLADAVLRAADRGVHVRVLIDDAETIPGDKKIHALEAHPAIEIRMFNPFAYRGHAMVFRAAEFMFNSSRLDYRMHNKLLVADNAAGLIGGRNIGDEYFQVDAKSQFADDDVFVVGPIVKQLSGTFDAYWNCALAIPIEALAQEKPSTVRLDELRDALTAQHEQMKDDGIDHVKRIASGKPFSEMISGRLPLVWAHAELVCDNPDKKQARKDGMVGWMMQRSVANAAAATRSELLMVTPFFIPGKDGMQLIKDLRERNVRVRILTNSLMSNPQMIAHSGYMHYRKPLLENNVELYEMRSLPGNARGMGQSAPISSWGNYGLLAKLFVFDRRQVYIGSMNFDERSMRLNTEVGLLIDSPDLARQIAARFDAMAHPENSYALALVPGDAENSPYLVWRTREQGKDVEYRNEPAQGAWQKIQVDFLSLFPLDQEL